MASSVAAIVPVFNESFESTARTLRALVAQTLQLEQIILVDDGSAVSPQLPDDLKDRVERMLLGHNVGQAAARNYAAMHTSAEYLLFVDSDVVLCAEWAERAVAFMGEHQECGAVSGPAVPRLGRPVLRRYLMQFVEPKVFRTAAEPTRVHWLVGHVLLVRRGVFAEINGYDPGHWLRGEDWDISQRIIEGGHELYHHPELRADNFERVTIDMLARKSLRNQGFDLHAASR